MHCLIVNHFKQKTSEKSVNRTSLVVLDIECIESNIVKEFIRMDKQKDIPFFFPKNSNHYPNLFGVHSIFMESIGAAVTKNILNLKKF